MKNKRDFQIVFARTGTIERLAISQFSKSLVSYVTRGETDRSSVFDFPFIKETQDLLA